MNKYCEWLHKALEALPMFDYRYRNECIPPNGIYFCYEKGETYGQEEILQRIVRIGSHTGPGNLPSRLIEHYYPPESWMNFDIHHPKAADRSIFRKHIGRALLNQNHDPYLTIWNIDFMKKVYREKEGHLRDINKEHSLEKQITAWIHSFIRFRFIIVNNEQYRNDLESHCIGTVASCPYHQPSTNWLGRKSPISKIYESGIWNVKHVNGPAITERERQIIETAIVKTFDWLSQHKC